MSTCRSCGAPVRWIKTVAGKAMPLDPEPSEEGNVVILGELARVLAAGETGEPRFLSHFATCPNAAQHRKPKP